MQSVISKTTFKHPKRTTPNNIGGGVVYQSKILSFKKFLLMALLLLFQQLSFAQNAASVAWKWTSPFDASIDREDWILSMINTSDCSSTVAVGYTENITKNKVPAIFKFDNFRKQIIWKTTLPNLGTDSDAKFWDVIEANGSFYAAGTYKIGTYNFQGVLLKIDANGNYAAGFPKYYGDFPGSAANSTHININAGVSNSTSRIRFYSIRQISNSSNFIIGADKYGIANSNVTTAALMRIDANGMPVTSFGTNNGIQTYNDDNVDTKETFLRNAIVDKAGQFVYFTGDKINVFAGNSLGDTNVNDRDIFVVKADATSGAKIWHKVWNKQSLIGSDYVDVDESTEKLDGLINPNSTPASNDDERGFNIEQIGNSDRFVVSTFLDHHLIQVDKNVTDVIKAVFREEYIDYDSGLVLMDGSGNMIQALNSDRFMGIDFFSPVKTNGNDIFVLGGRYDPTQAGQEIQNAAVKLNYSPFKDKMFVNWRKNFIAAGALNCPFAMATTCDGSIVVGGNNDLHDEDYYLIKLGDDCQNNFTYDEDGNRTLTSNETWSSSKTIRGKITVPNGKTLTINNNAVIQFASTWETNEVEILAQNAPNTVVSKIVVQCGGKLNLSSCRLKGLNACNKEYMWEGIEVQGNPGVPQSATNQGVLSMSNATIENARTAIVADVKYYNSDGNETNYNLNGGGIVNGFSSNFLNCRRGVFFAPYSQPNNSFFTNTNFYCTQQLVDPFFTDSGSGFRMGVSTHAAMYGTNGIYFSDCRWSSLSTFPLDLRGNGIVSFDAGFRVTGTSANGNCAGTPNFQNLQQGISANSVFSTRRIDITANCFQNVQKGVYIKSGQFHNITNNAIFGNAPSVATPGQDFWGIRLDGTSDYLIKGNSIASTQYGIITDGTAANASSIEKNTFNKLYVGNQAQGSNPMLQISCNSYTKQEYAWAINPTSSGVFPDQGQCGTNKKQAGNSFYDAACQHPESHIYSTIPFVYSNGSYAYNPTCRSAGVTLNTCNLGQVNQNSCTPEAPPCPQLPCDVSVQLGNIQNELNPVKRQLLRNELVRVYLDANNLTDAMSVVAEKVLAQMQTASGDYAAAQTTLNQLASMRRSVGCGKLEPMRKLTVSMP